MGYVTSPRPPCPLWLPQKVPISYPLPHSRRLFGYIIRFVDLRHCSHVHDAHKSRSLGHHRPCQRRDVPAPEPIFAPQSLLAVPEAPLQVTGRPVPGSAEIATPLDVAQSGRVALSTGRHFISNTDNSRATLAAYCNRFDSSIVDGMPWRRLTGSRSQGLARLCCAVR